MKKALSTAILATVLIASSAWADDSDVNTINTETTQEMRTEIREIKNEVKDYRKEEHDKIKQARTRCQTRLDAAGSEAEKESIKAECKAEIALAREALRENIKALRQEKYTTVLANLKARIEKNLITLKALPQDKKDAWKAKVIDKLNDLEGKADESQNDPLIITINSLRDIIAQI